MYKNKILTDNDFIAMAKIVDNNFIGNNHIKIDNKPNLVRVYGHTKGGQCCNCDVKFILKDNFIESILTQNEDTEIEGAYRSITNETFNKIKEIPFMPNREVVNNAITPLKEWLQKTYNTSLIVSISEDEVSDKECKHVYYSTPYGYMPCEKCRNIICNCDVYEKIISEIKQKMIDSKNPNNKTKRTGDYRIGLKKAIEIIEKNYNNGNE